MAKNDQLTTTTPAELVAVDPDQWLQRAEQLLDTIPEITEDPTPRMAALILNADTPKAINRLFESRAIKASVGRKARFDALRRAPSDFEGGPQWYLICDVTWADTGEQDVLTVSSVMSMLELLQAAHKGWLPLTAEVVQKERATKRGFHPIHLRIVDYTQPDTQTS